MTKLEQLLSCITAAHVYIQTHNYPDPDALASAKGLQALLECKGIPSTICFKGHIDKFNTLKMMELLHIEIFHGNSLGLTEKDEIILVDCQKGNTNVKGFSGDEIACIDHHPSPKDSEVTYRFSDIQNNVGACATLIANYFTENNIPFSTEVATALLYGIKMDTANLTRGVSNMDIDMFAHLYKLADKQILHLLDSNSLSLKDLDSYAKAIANLQVYDTIGFANIGNGCSEAIIGTLSDFILSLSEVRFAVVYSYRAGGLKFSVRSENPLWDSAKIIRQALNGYGDGGGHSIMAAGFIPDLSEEEAAQMARNVEKKILEQIESIERNAT